MALENDLMSRVRAMLAHVHGVEEKRMFGSLAFMVRGNMCITARADRIMCRIDPALHDEAIKRKGCSTVVMKAREYRGYVYVDAASVKTDKALRYWVELSLAFNETVVSAKKRKAR